MGDFDQEDPLGILEKKKSSKQEDPLGILKKKDGGIASIAGGVESVSSGLSNLPQENNADVSVTPDNQDKVYYQGIYLSFPKQPTGAADSIQGAAQVAKDAQEDRIKKITSPLSIESFNKQFERNAGINPSLDLGSDLPQIKQNREQKKFLEYRVVEDSIQKINNGNGTFSDFRTVYEKTPKHFETIAAVVAPGVNKEEIFASDKPDELKEDALLFQVEQSYKNYIYDHVLESSREGRQYIAQKAEESLKSASQFTGVEYTLPANIDETQKIIGDIEKKKAELAFMQKAASNSMGGSIEAKVKDILDMEAQVKEGSKVLPYLQELVGGFVFSEQIKVNPNITPFEVGEKIYEITNPQMYKIWKEAGGGERYSIGGNLSYRDTPRKADAINRQMTELGINAFNLYGNKEAISKAADASKSLGWEFTGPIEEQTKHMIAAQLFERGIKPHKATKEEKDAIAQTLPELNRKVWFEKNIPENNDDLPSTGFGRSVSGSYHNTIEDAVKTTFGWLIPNRGRERALDVLEQQSVSNTVGENPESRARLNQLSEKENEGTLTPEEAQEKKELQQYTGVRTWANKALDLMGSGVGQFAGFGTISAFTGGLSGASTGLGVLKSLVSPAAGRGGMLAAGYLMSRESNARDAVQMFPGEEEGIKRFVATEVFSGIDTFVERLFPEERFLSGLIKKDVATLIPKLTAKNIRAELNEKLVSKIAKTVAIKIAEQQKTPVQESIEEVASLVFKDIFTGTLDPDFAGDPLTTEDILQTATQAYLSSQLLGVPKGVMATRNPTVPLNAIWDAASNKGTYFDTKMKIIELRNTEDLTEQEANDRISLLNTAQKFYEDNPVLSGNMGSLPLPKRQNYLGRLMNEAVLQKQADAATDDLVKEQINKEISESKKARKAIFDGDIEVTERNEENPVATEVKDKDAILLEEIKKKGVGPEEQNENINYFIDKVAESPVRAVERFGQEIVDELLPRVTTDQLNKQYQFHARIDMDSPETIELERLIEERAQQKEGGPKKESRISVILPEENTMGEVVPLKKTEAAPQESVIPEKEIIERERPAIEEWIKNSDEHNDYISFEWDGENLEIFKSRDAAPVELSRKELEEEGVNFPAAPTPQVAEVSEGKENIKGLQRKANDRYEGLSELPEVETHESVLRRAKTGTPIEIEALRIQKSDETNKETGVFFADKGIINEYRARERDGFYGEENKGLFDGDVKKYKLSFKNPLVIRSQVEFIKELADKGDLEAREVLPDWQKEYPLFTNHKTYADRDAFVARKAIEFGYDGIVTPLEYIALGKNFIKVESKQPTNEASTQEAVIENEPVNAEETAQPEAGTTETGSETIPPQPPTEEKATEGEEDGVGITHAQTTEIANQLGFPSYEKDPQTVEQWDKEADERIKKGEIGVVIEKLEKGTMPSNVEQRMIAKYVAELQAQVDQNPTDEKLAELKYIIELSDIIGGREVAKSLVARKGTFYADNSLSGYLIREMEEEGVDKLTQGQKITVEKEFKDITQARQEYEEWVAKKEEELNQREAALSIEEMKKKKGTRSKDLAKQREQIIGDIILKLQNAPPSFLGAGQLAAIAPDVIKLARNLVDTGVTKLSELTQQVVDLLKDKVNISDKEVNAILAGKHTERKPTKNELTARWNDLREEAKLIDRLDALERGEEPKTEKKKIERNREITDLRKKIKEHDITQLAQAKTRIKGQIDKITEQLRTGDFSKAEKKEIKFDDEGRQLQGKLLDLRKKREIRIEKSKYERRTKKQKLADNLADIMNIPRSIMASTDFSAPLNQAAVATTAYPILAKQAAKQMFKSALSQQAFDQWFYDLKDSPRYDLMKDLKLKISDPHSSFLVAREEAFMSGYAEQIPGFGRIIKGSERAYVQFLNKMRVDLFNKFVDKYENDGKTYEKNKKLYEKTAKYINNITGAGDLGKLDQYAPLFSALLFSPRLIASRLRLLNPWYVANLPRPLLKSYAKDMGLYLSTRAALLGAFALYGKTQGDDDPDKVTVESDPRSSDFGKVRQGDTRWDISGGFQPYMRLASQIATGKRKTTTTGEIQSFDSNIPHRGQGENILRFGRAKLAPVPSMVWDMIEGENVVGEKVTWKSMALRNLPLSIQSIIEGSAQQGFFTPLTIVAPSIFGVGVQTYGPREKEISDKVTISRRVGGKSVEFKVDLTSDQFKEYESLAKKYIEIDVKKMEALSEYKELSNNEKAAAKRNIENAAVRKAEKAIVKKYERTFKISEAEKEKADSKKNINKIKSKIN